MEKDEHLTALLAETRRLREFLVLDAAFPESAFDKVIEGKILSHFKRKLE